MHLNFSVDWISATIKPSQRKNEFNFMNFFDGEGDRIQSKPMFGYNKAERWKFGAIMMWNSERPEMGVHIILSGSTLKFLAEREYDALWLLNRFIFSNAKLTRVDLALDVYDAGLMPQDLYDDFMKGEKTGRAQNASVISNSFGGSTLYVGSWSADRFYRYYDKAAEQGIEGKDWKRLELILKGMYARSFAAGIATDPTLNKALRLMKGSIKTMANFKRDVFQKILEGEAEKLSMPYHETSKTREWLLTQVASAMAKYIHQTGDDEIVNDFGAELDRLYKALVESN